MSPKIRANDLNFYSAVTDPAGPAMTWSMTAVGYLEIGQPSVAAAYFKEGYANIQEPFNIWLETPTGGATNFLTGAGGFLQSVMFGYGGLRLNGTALWLDPQLPLDTAGIRLLGIEYLASTLDIEWNSTTVTVALTGPGPIPLALQIGPRVVPLTSVPYEFPVQQAAILRSVH
jgi:trehalose/maltose hydrolase-like predicted phosphorylase